MIIKNDKLIKVERSDVIDGVLTIPNGIKTIKNMAFADVMLYLVWDYKTERYVTKQDVKIDKIILPRSLKMKEIKKIQLKLLVVKDVVIAEKEDEEMTK